MTRYARGPLETRVVEVFETHLAATPTRVAQVLADYELNSVSKVLRNLHQRGQVSRQPGKRGRSVEYFLTPAQRSALL